MSYNSFTVRRIKDFADWHTRPLQIVPPNHVLCFGIFMINLEYTLSWVMKICPVPCSLQSNVPIPMHANLIENIEMLFEILSLLRHFHCTYKLIY